MWLVTITVCTVDVVSHCTDSASHYYNLEPVLVSAWVNDDAFRHTPQRSEHMFGMCTRSGHTVHCASRTLYTLSSSVKEKIQQGNRHNREDVFIDMTKNEEHEPSENLSCVCVRTWFCLPTNCLGDVCVHRRAVHMQHLLCAQTHCFQPNRMTLQQMSEVLTSSQRVSPAISLMKPMQSHCLSLYPPLMTIGEGWSLDCLVNLSTKLVECPHYCWLYTNQPFNLTLHFTFPCEQGTPKGTKTYPLWGSSFLLAPVENHDFGCAERDYSQ